MAIRLVVPVTLSIFAFVMFVACGNPSKPTRLSGSEDVTTLSNYANDKDESDSGKDRWSKYVAKQRLKNPMWEPEKVRSLSQFNGMVLAEFEMYVIQLNGGGGARVKVGGTEFWFEGLASGYIDDRVYTFSGVIEPGGANTYRTVLGAPRTLPAITVVYDGVPDISHIAKKQRAEIQNKQREEKEEQDAIEKKANDAREAAQRKRDKILFQQSLRLITPEKKEAVILGSSPLAIAESAKNKELRAQFAYSKDIIELTEETTVSLVEEGKDFSKVKYGEKTYYVATKHLAPMKK